LTFASAIVWRGLVYGAADGLLLSAFPILLVLAALQDSRLRQRAAGLLAVLTRDLRQDDGPRWARLVR
jgi:hypothetical protein